MTENLELAFLWVGITVALFASVAICAVMGFKPAKPEIDRVLQNSEIGVRDE